MTPKSRATQADALQRYAHMSLATSAYVQQQLQGMVAHFKRVKPIVDWITLEPHDHDGRPVGTPYSILAHSGTIPHTHPSVAGIACPFCQAAKGVPCFGPGRFSGDNSNPSGTHHARVSAWKITTFPKENNA